jgi:hypothetical protein
MLRPEAACESGSIAPLFLTSAVDGGKWTASCPGRFIRNETAHPPSAHCMGGWGGRESLSECYGEDENILFLPGTECLFLDLPARNLLSYAIVLVHDISTELAHVLVLISSQ